MTRWICMFAILATASQLRAETPNQASPDADAVMKAMAEMATPGAEHKKLDVLAGKWDYAGKFWMVPDKPPMETKGTIERKWILGDRFLHENVMGEGFDGKSDFEGRGVIGYDNAQKKFTSAWICNMCTSITTSTGTYDSSTKTFTFERESYCPIRKKMVKGRDVIRVESNDKVIMEGYETDDGKEVKMMELVSTRQT